MKPVGMSAIDQLINLFQDLLIEIQYLVPANRSGSVKGNITGIGNGNSDEIKAPIGHPLKIFRFVLSAFICFGTKEVQKIKASPPRQLVFWSRGNLGKCLMAYKAYSCCDDGCIFQKPPSRIIWVHFKKG